MPVHVSQDRLAEVEEDGSINYTKFLERYRVQVKRIGQRRMTSVPDREQSSCYRCHTRHRHSKRSYQVATYTNRPPKAHNQVASSLEHDSFSHGRCGNRGRSCNDMKDVGGKVAENCSTKYTSFLQKLLQNKGRLTVGRCSQPSHGSGARRIHTFKTDWSLQV